MPEALALIEGGNGPRVLCDVDRRCVDVWFEPDGSRGELTGEAWQILS